MVRVQRSGLDEGCWAAGQCLSAVRFVCARERVIRSVGIVDRGVALVGCLTPRMQAERGRGWCGLGWGGSERSAGDVDRPWIGS